MTHINYRKEHWGSSLRRTSNRYYYPKHPIEDGRGATLTQEQLDKQKEEFFNKRGVINKIPTGISGIAHLGVGPKIRPNKKQRGQHHGRTKSTKPKSN